MVNDHHTEQKLIEANPVSRPEHLHGDPSEAQALLALIMERRDAMTMTKTPLPTRPPVRPRWQPARIAAVTAVLLILVVGLTALIGFTGDETDSTDQATTVPPVESTIPETGPTVTPGTAAPVTTLPATTVPATLFDGAWTLETSTESFPRFEVMATSLGYFSRGDNIAGREGGPGVWFSPDGADWQQVLTMPVGEVIEDAELLPGEPPLYTIEASVRSLIEYEGAVYAFATIADQPHGPDRAVEQIAYRTTDGVEFEAITYSTESFSPSVIAGENEMLVIFESGRAATSILRSEDGYNWNRHEPDVTIQTPNDAAAFVDGRYLAVGEYAGGDENERRTMVESPDGIAWTEVTGGEFAANDFPRFLTEYQGMFYMGGLYFDEAIGGQQTGMVFHSEDGRRWQRATMPAIPDLAFVNDLIPTEYGLLAVGWAGWSDDPARLVPMTTIDGTTFVEIPHAEGLFNAEEGGYNSARDGQAIVLFGNDFDPLLFHEWTWTPTG